MHEDFQGIWPKFIKTKCFGQNLIIKAWVNKDNVDRGTGKS
jgi:hypothetical protein